MQNTDNKALSTTLSDGLHAVPAAVDPKTARKEAINDMKRTQMMDAAIKVIARDGYVDARLEDIAMEAGFSKASVYLYFPDKEALFIHAMARQQQVVHEECVKIIDSNLPFLETIRQFVTIFFGRFFMGGNHHGAQHIGHMRSSAMMFSLFASMNKHKDLFIASILDRRRNTLELLAKTVSKAKQDGVLTIPVDDRAICNFITSFFHSFILENMLGGWTHKENETATQEDFIKAVDSMFAFLKPWVKPSQTDG